MELLDVINRRRTVRDFEQTEVPFEIIHKALAAGLRAPSYNHQKEWYFLLIREQDSRLSLIKAVDSSDTISERMQNALEKFEPLAREMYLEAIPKQNKMIMASSAVLVIVYKPKMQISESKTVADMNCLAAVWCCIENILLSFAQDDVYATTLVPDNTPAIKAAMNIPETLEVAAIIPFGYKSLSSRVIPQKEVSVESALHREKW